MKNRFDDEVAKNYDDLELRVYTSNLLGCESQLVLHGGGNTSVKIDDILYVKGSGWNLDTIKKEGFAPVKMDTLLNMAKLDSLSDIDMVTQQKEAMIDKDAPNPSVEAILHALIPFKFVDHTHSDAVVTLCNNHKGLEIIEEIYENYLIVPYVMPGFILAKTIYEMTKDIDWNDIEGIILHNHGIFTFDDNAKRSYDKMIEAVTKAQNYINKPPINIVELKDIMSKAKGYEVSIKINTSFMMKLYSSLSNIDSLSQVGILTPEHVIRTKRTPLLTDGKNIIEDIEKYVLEYKKYFNTYAKDETMLNPAPNWIVVKGYGTIAIGKNDKEANIIDDINTHTVQAILDANSYGGFVSISKKDTFDMEYWSLEQAKLK